MDWLSLRAPLEAWLKSAGAAKFSDEDLRVLWQGGYNTLVDLKVATRASLERAGLRPARVDQILSAQGADAGTSNAAAGRAGASFEEFWKKLPKAVVAQSSQNFEVLQLADGTAFPDPGHSTTLLVRPCYHTLCKKIFASVGKSDPPSRQVLIRGTPGIGKSTFLDYLLYRLACQGKTVVWCSKSVLDSVLLFTPNGVFEATSTAAFREELRDPSTWFLCDAVEPPSKVAITVMASSPRNSNYNEYAKQAGLRLWMGPWSYVELEAARGIMFSSVSKAKLSELYARWGGIPRYVLKYAANPELQEELDAAVATVNMDLLWKSVGNIEAAPDVSHKLIHVEVDENCSRKRLVFGSGIIGQRVMQELHRQGTAELAKFVKWSAGRPDLASLRGIMFQGLAHYLLCRGGSFRMRSLSNPGEQEVSLEVPEMELMEVQDSDLKKISPTTKGSGLLVPVARNFTAVDSFLILPDSNGKAARLLLIQVTVSANHRISASGLQTSMRKLSRDLKGLKREMYFAVPPDLFKQFRKQQFEGAAKDSIEIDQFAIEIPLVGFAPGSESSSPGSSSSSSSSNVPTAGRGGHVAPSALSRSPTGISIPRRSHLPRLNPRMVILPKPHISSISSAAPSWR